MIEGRALLAFLGAGLVLLLTPGPAVLYIVAQSLRGGFRAGFVSCLGLLTGGAIHLVLAVAGVSLLLLQAPAALQGIRLAGGVYFAWLAVGSGRRAIGSAPAPRELTADTSRHLYRRGVLVNVFNPKAPLFFFAFLPQFVRPEAGPAWMQLGAFGLLFLAMGLCTDSAWAWVAARAGVPLRARLGGRGAVAGHWLSAMVYALLAVGAIAG